jgi:hypothetical protein
MNNELETMWKENIVAYIKVLPLHLSGQTEVNNKKPQSG